jgi:hypothetical protein
MGAAGIGLAAAGRANSPASQMGSGLMSSMLGYYANQAATAEERARRMRMEDEQVQRQRTADTQNEDYRRASLLLNSGGFEPSLTGGPTDQKITFGQNSIYLRPKPQVAPEAWGGIISNAYGPDFAAQFTKSTAGMSPQQVQAMLPTFLESFKAAKQQEETSNLSNTIGALGRETPKVTPEMELGMGTPPPMNPPAFTPPEVAGLQMGVRIPEARTKTIERMNERLGEIGMVKRPVPKPTPEPGQTYSQTVIERPGKPGSEVHTTYSPENPQRGIDKKDSEWASAEAARLEKSPGYQALKSSAGPAGKEGLTTLLNGAKAGNLAALQTLVAAMTNTGTTADSLDKEKLAYYKAHPGLLDKVILQGVAAGDPNRHSADKLVETLGSQIRQEETDITTVPPAHPTYPAKAKSLASRYRAIADAAPESWGKYAFQRMGELLGWDQATYAQERAAFAAKHGLQTKGGK